ncbi:hypothetical protein [Clostridium sp.]|uniref:YczE/YyaS/YitT family protein n=1 Tax=Clostridium sp. TaxID=1506 RepID=UPI001D24898A|nr:hypothetical protein [Clostridium sp.]MBS5936957.1 hypothetical protein [Clostridium sp.]
MKESIKLIKRVFLFFIGMSIIQVGVALFLKTNIGSDPFTAFTQGVAFTLNKTGIRNLSIIEFITGSANITPGVSNMIILIILFCTILIIDRRKINIGTLICVIGVGPIIDFSFKIVSIFPVETYSYLTKCILIILGCFIVAVGFSLLSSSNLGVAPNDIIPFIIKDKMKIEFRWSRMIFDGCCLLLGVLFGGIIGIGTIICMLFTGPFIQMMLPFGKKVIEKVI